MKFLIGSNDIKIHFVVSDSNFEEFDENLRTHLNDMPYKAKHGEIFENISLDESGIVIVGLGEKEDLDREKIISAAFIAKNLLEKKKIKSASIASISIDGFSNEDLISLIAEGFLHADYNFDYYKTEKTEYVFEELSFEFEISQKEFSKVIDSTTNLIEGVHIARDLINLTAEDMYPEVLAKRALELRKLGVEVEVYGQSQIEEMNMKAFLSVAKGSSKEPKFIVMKYLPLEDESAIALVGKGITYDSGGYAIKPAGSMSTMQSDMSGAAAVIGSIYSLAKNSVKKNVVGVVAACENMISGSSYKNGDIISSMKGTSIEVVNTDAEGRVTLADSIYYAASKVDSECIIDLATLTGACIVALGNQITGAMTNDEELLEKLKEAADYSSEKIWQLPIDSGIREQIVSKRADIKNSTKGGAGASTAAAFLEKFVENKPWVHLDIAGPSWADSPWSYNKLGGTGIMVKTLYNFVRSSK